jgi:hypothetical protein
VLEPIPTRTTHPPSPSIAAGNILQDTYQWDDYNSEFVHSHGSSGNVKQGAKVWIKMFQWSPTSPIQVAAIVRVIDSIDYAAEMYAAPF